MTEKLHYIEFRHVYKTFDRPVLVDSNFYVDVGETLAIIGRSGVGKSVSLGHIMGFLKPDQGQVFVAYQDITNFDEAQLREIRKKVTIDSPGLMDRVNGIVGQEEAALPNFLAMTNQIATTLSNSMQLTSNLNAVAAGIRPAVNDVAAITANLRDPHGSLGEWLIPTNVNQELAATLLNANGAITNANLALTNVNGALTNVNTNLAMVFDGVGRSLDNLADITSNLNHQVQVNSNMLGEISKIIVDSDNFVQGLKHHWLLRSAFKPAKTNATPRAVTNPYPHK